MSRARGSLRAVPARRTLTAVLGESGAATTDDLLAPAGAGLRALAAHDARSAEALTARLDRHARVDLAGLASTAAALRAQAERVRGRHRELADEAGGLWDSWAGPQADDVADRVGSLGRGAAEVAEVLDAAAEGIEEAGIAVVDAVRAVGEAAAALETEAAGAGRPAAVARVRTRVDTADTVVARAWTELAARLPERLDPTGDDPTGWVPDSADLEDLLGLVAPEAAPDPPGPGRGGADRGNADRGGADWEAGGDPVRRGPRPPDAG